MTVDSTRMVLFCIIMAYTTSLSYGEQYYYTMAIDDACIGRLNRCNDALNAAQEVIKAQDVQIGHLKNDIKALEEELIKSQTKTIPTWALALSTTSIGLAIGGPLVGLPIGVITGLLFQ